MAKDEKPEKPPSSAREVKLAQALRANLRRRKGTAGAGKAPKQDKPSS